MKIFTTTNTVKPILHPSHVLGDQNVEEEQFNSFRLGLLLNHDDFKGFTNPYCSEIFLGILVSGLRVTSSSQLFSCTCLAGLSPSMLGASLGPGLAPENCLAVVDPAQSRNSLGLMLNYEHRTLGCEMLFLVLIYSSLKGVRVCKQLGRFRCVFQ